jgi:hypothetical protein
MNHTKRKQVKKVFRSINQVKRAYFPKAFVEEQIEQKPVKKLEVK